MLSELIRLLSVTVREAVLADFRRAVVEENVLGKRSATTREHTIRKLKALYGLDPQVPVYRVMRELWDQDPEGRPLMAVMCAVARDPLLRASVGTVLDLPFGTLATSVMMAATVSDRFSPSTRRSIGSNIAASWTQAGHLSGVTKKIRTRAQATPGSTAYALALGFMEGGRGSLLLSTRWIRLLDQRPDDLSLLVQRAARRGWIEYRAVGDVIDLRLDALMTAEERSWCDGQ
jgi:hypothetical protein